MGRGCFAVTVGILVLWIHVRGRKAVTQHSTCWQGPCLAWTRLHQPQRSCCRRSHTPKLLLTGKEDPPCSFLEQGTRSGRTRDRSSACFLGAQRDAGPRHLTTEAESGESEARAAGISWRIRRLTRVLSSSSDTCPRRRWMPGSRSRWSLTTRWSPTTAHTRACFASSLCAACRHSRDRNAAPTRGTMHATKT